MTAVSEPLAGRPIENVLGRLQRVRRSGDSWQAQCPGHDDSTPSLSVKELEDGVVLLCCHAGCPPERVLHTIGLTFTDLYPDRHEHGTAPTAGSDVVATYDYADESGKVLFQVRRTKEKKFLQYHPDDNGGWVKGVQGVRRVPYRLPWLLGVAKAGGLLFLVEGEKDVHTLEGMGFVATTTPGGANAWRDEYAPHFQGARVVVLPDNDDAGQGYAEKAAAALRGVAAEVCVVALPGLKAKGDVTDWVRAGGTREVLEKLTQPRRPRRPVTSEEATALFLADLDRRARGEVRGLPWPPSWSRLGEAIGPLEPGTLTVIAARPSMGKTIFAQQYQAFLSDRGFRVLYVSRELTPERLVRRHLVREGASIQRLKIGKLTEEDLQAKERYLERQRSWSVLYDHVSRTTAEIGKVASEHQAECIMVDYLQRLAYNEEKEYAALTRLANEFQDLALDMDIPVILVSQLSRPLKGQDHKPPTMSDVRGSGAIEERAATIVLLHRDWKTTKNDQGREVATLRLETGSFIVAKNADGEADLWQPMVVQGERMRIVESTAESGGRH